MDGEYSLRKLVTMLGRSLGRRFKEAYAPRLSVNLSQLEAMCFDFISNRNCRSASDLVSEFNINKSTVSESLMSLEGKGLIKTSVSSEDKRKRDIVVTEKGWAFHDEFEEVNKVYEAHIAQILGGEQNKESLYSALKKLSDALDQGI